jgi:hypothetical protein
MDISRMLKSGRAREAAGISAEGRTAELLRLLGPDFDSFPCGDGRDKLVGPCPVCRADGGDSEGRHLVIYEDGKFGCVTSPTDSPLGTAQEHRRQVWAAIAPVLKGAGSLCMPEPRKPDPAVLAAYEAAKKAGRAALEKAISRWGSGDLETELGPSAEIPDHDGQLKLYLSAWAPAELTWIGRQKGIAAPLPAGILADRGHQHGWDHARTVVFKPKATQRRDRDVLSIRLRVVEHDHLDMAGQIALIRLVSEKLGLPRWVIFSGGKSLHAHFDEPADPAVTRSIEALLEAVGGDLGAFTKGRSRVPGAVRVGSGGKRQPLVWIRPENL